MSMRGDRDVVVMSSPAVSRAAEREPQVLRVSAQVISHVLSPPVATVASAFLVATRDGSPTAFLAAITFSVLGVVLPLLALVKQWRAGEISDLEVTRKDQRFWPMLLTTTCVGGAAIILQLVGAPPSVAGLASILGVQSLVLLMVTTSWKISVHCAAVSSLVGLAVLAGLAPAVALVGSMAMIWSRLALRRHTVLQCVGGTILGAGLVLLLWPVLGA